MFISVASLAEIRRGIELLPAGPRRTRLTEWLADELPARFDERIINIDPPIAQAWGVVSARCQRAGVTIGSMDAFFAATAEAHALTLVTRNINDYARSGIALIDPWKPRRAS